MKKIVLAFSVLLLLCGCGKNKAEQISEITKMLYDETTSEETSYDEATSE